MTSPIDPQPVYSAMSDDELDDRLRMVINPPPPGAQASFIDWVPLFLELLRRIREAQRQQAP